MIPFRLVFPPASASCPRSANFGLRSSLSTTFSMLAAINVIERMESTPFATQLAEDVASSSQTYIHAVNASPYGSVAVRRPNITPQHPTYLMDDAGWKTQRLSRRGVKVGLSAPTLAVPGCGKIIVVGAVAWVGVVLGDERVPVERKCRVDVVLSTSVPSLPFLLLPLPSNTRRQR